MTHTYTPVAILSDCGNQYSVALVDEAQGKQHQVVIDLNDKDGTKEPRIIFSDQSSVNVSGNFVRSFLALPNHNVLNPTQKKLFCPVQDVSDPNQKQRNKIADRICINPAVDKNLLVSSLGYAFEISREAATELLSDNTITLDELVKASRGLQAMGAANYQSMFTSLFTMSGSNSCVDPEEMPDVVDFFDNGVWRSMQDLTPVIRDRRHEITQQFGSADKPGKYVGGFKSEIYLRNKSDLTGVCYNLGRAHELFKELLFVKKTDVKDEKGGHPQAAERASQYSMTVSSGKNASGDPVVTWVLDANSDKEFFAKITINWQFKEKYSLSGVKFYEVIFSMEAPVKWSAGDVLGFTLTSASEDNLLFLLQENGIQLLGALQKYFSPSLPTLIEEHQKTADAIKEPSVKSVKDGQCAQDLSDLNQKHRNKIAQQLLILVTKSPLAKIAGFSFESASFVDAIQNVIQCLPVTKKTSSKKSSTQMADMIAKGLWRLGFKSEARLLGLALGTVSCGLNKSEVCLKKDYLSPDNIFFPAGSVIHGLGPDYGIATITLGENSFYSGIEFMRGSQLDFYNNQQVRRGTLAENAIVDGIECMLGTEVQFDSMGKLQYGTSSHNKEVFGHQCNETSIGLYYFDAKPVWRDGSLRGILAKDQVVIRKPPVEIRGESELSFHNNCKLEYGILSRDQRINGVFFKGGTELRTSKDNLARNLSGILAQDQIIGVVEYKGGTKIVIDITDGHVVKGILAKDQKIGGILFGAGTEFQPYLSEEEYQDGGGEGYKYGRVGFLAKDQNIHGVLLKSGTKIQQSGDAGRIYVILPLDHKINDIHLAAKSKVEIWTTGYSVLGQLTKDQRIHGILFKGSIQIRQYKDNAHVFTDVTGTLAGDHLINGLWFGGGTEIATTRNVANVKGVSAKQQIIYNTSIAAGQPIASYDCGEIVNGYSAEGRVEESDGGMGLGGYMLMSLFTGPIVPLLFATGGGEGGEEPGRHALCEAKVNGQSPPMPVQLQPDAETALLQGAYDTIKSIFADETISREWEAWIKTQNPTKEKLVAYAQDLQRLKNFLGNADFQKVITTPFDDNTDNIIVRQTQHMTPQRMEQAHDTYQGIVRTDVSVDRLKNAIWQHGDAYGAGEIAAPYVACSSIERKISASRVVQQIVLDIPWPGENLMTMNDTELTRYGAFGWEIAWTGLSEGDASWRCLDTSNSGTDFNFNLGQWRLLPISGNKTIIWYATKSDSKGLNAPDNKAKSALCENILAFSKAAEGYYGN